MSSRQFIPYVASYGQRLPLNEMTLLMFHSLRFQYVGILLFQDLSH